MICVCIGRSRHKRMIAEHQYLVEQGIRLVELRLDHIAGTVNVKRLVADRPGPVIVTCRRQEDGGQWSGTEEERVTLLRAAIAEGVEYVDLEDDIASSIPRFGDTKRIVSHHDFSETPDDLTQLHASMAAMDADIVKLATMANWTRDNVRMLSLIASADVPTVGLCMGDIGTPTRILATKFGSPFTFASFTESKSIAPGQLSYRQMDSIYGQEKIGPDTQVFGVIADPVAHSLSPHIHNASYHDLGHDCVYIPFRVPESDLAQFIDDCGQMGVQGLSVTIPHKETVLKHCTKPDEAVDGIGATNTLVFRDGEVFAHNTDCSAAMDSLEESLGITESTSTSLQGKVAMLLGGGGVAKAIAFGLRQRGAEVVVAVRSPEKAQSLHDKLGCQITAWDQRHDTPADILVNCTPIGMHPKVDASPFDAEHMHGGMVVFDTIYNPEETMLIQGAKQAGSAVVTGVDMFVRQAAIQFQHFTGTDAPMNVMRTVLKHQLGQDS